MFQSVGRILRWAKGYRRRDAPGLCVLLLRHLVHRRAGNAGCLGPGTVDRKRLGRKRTPGLSSWLCLGGIVVLILLRFFFTYWKNRLQESIGTERAADQRMELGNVLKRVSLGYFARNNLGDI